MPTELALDPAIGFFKYMNVTTNEDSGQDICLEFLRCMEFDKPRQDPYWLELELERLRKPLQVVNHRSLRLCEDGFARVKPDRFIAKGEIPFDPRPPIDHVQALALRYFDAGLLPIPIELDGTKSPYRWVFQPRGREVYVPCAFSWGQWAKLRNGEVPPRPSRELISHWFDRPCGIGLACGAASGGLEVLDFDDPETFIPWLESIPLEIRNKLCLCRTGGLGFHVLYRCESIQGNTKLATLKPGSGGKETRIETRGQDGYIVAAGSPLETHNSGNHYMWVEGHEVTNIQTITPKERAILWRATMPFHWRDPHEDVVEVELRNRKNQTYSGEFCEGTPWDDFDRLGVWSEILVGWTQTTDRHWVRPGKRSGTSAVIGTNEDGLEIITVFSANAGPLSPASGQSHASHGKFAAYTKLHHGGNRRAAARELRSRGYGK